MKSVNIKIDDLKKLIDIGDIFIGYTLEYYGHKKGFDGEVIDGDWMDWEDLGQFIFKMKQMIEN